jgi:hypothetical protein
VGWRLSCSSAFLALCYDTSLASGWLFLKFGRLAYGSDVLHTLLVQSYGRSVLLVKSFTFVLDRPSFPLYLSTVSTDWGSSKWVGGLGWAGLGWAGLGDWLGWAGISLHLRLQRFLIAIDGIVYVRWDGRMRFRMMIGFICIFGRSWER